MPLPTPVDLVAVVRQALLAQTPVTALVSTRMYDRVPAAPVWPLITIATVDEGEASEPWRGDARVQVNCWGAGGSETQTAAARLIGRTVRAVSRDLKGTYAAGTIDVCSPIVMLPQPDTETGRARFIVDLSVSTVT